MKLTKTTEQILKNFSKISSTILIKEGSILKTQSASRDVLASAVLDVEFPKTFPCYDLSRFLNVLSLFQEPELDFSEDNVVIIGDGKNSVRYSFSDEAIVQGVDYERVIKMPETICEFNLLYVDFEKLMKGANNLSVDQLQFNGKSGKLTIVAKASKGSDDMFRMPMDNVVVDEDFSATFKVDTLKFVPVDLHVTLSSTITGKNLMIGKFEAAEPKIEYWVAGNVAGK